MNLVDTHCHLSFEQFDEDLVEVLDRAQKAGVQKIICIGCRVEDAHKTLELVEKYNNLYATIGLHPCDVDEDFEKDIDTLANLATHEKVVAIGETGLDFFREENPSERLQRASFQKNYELAKKLEKPLVIHSRSLKAREQTLEMLSSFGNQPFVWHCFSEDMECAEAILELGGMISFTGVVTFPGRGELKHTPTAIQEVAKKIPLERIMVETDAPYLAPPPNRGKRCEPAFVVNTARFIAELRNMEVEEFANATTKNAERFFGIG